MDATTTGFIVFAALEITGIGVSVFVPYPDWSKGLEQGYRKSVKNADRSLYGWAFQTVAQLELMAFVLTGWARCIPLITLAIIAWGVRFNRKTKREYEDKLQKRLVEKAEHEAYLADATRRIQEILDSTYKS